MFGGWFSWVHGRDGRAGWKLGSDISSRYDCADAQIEGRRDGLWGFHQRLDLIARSVNDKSPHPVQYTHTITSISKYVQQNKSGVHFQIRARVSNEINP